TVKKAPIIKTPTSIATSMSAIAHGGAQSRLIVAIGASTGGTEATLEILKYLPAEFPPIVVTQHMPVGFTKMYAERLNRICPMRVEEATNGMRCEQGLAIIAVGDKQMTLERDARGYFVRCVEGEKVSGHCPSVDVLFNSVAKTAGSNAIGVILTGMGRDGANGLLAMRNKSSYTIGQCKESCVVYGMPMEAQKLGAVEIEAPVENIAGMLVRKINSLGK
ncbi:MAG: CheB methylesterase domain-containing protein, partial [Oscillospiraceae bacterium]